MCGIVGVAGNLTSPILRAFEELLIINQTRGRDSTGVVEVPCAHKAPPKIHKALGTPDNLFNQIKPERRAKTGIFPMSKVLIGHNRAATIGDINIDNAHPFSHKGVHGVHNGTLRDWEDLVNFTENDVDSKSLIQNIGEEGVENTWPKFTGAAAVVFWDENTERLTFIRNDRRPLFFCYLNNGTALMWASERRHIEFVLAGHNLTPTKKDGSQYFYFKPDTAYSWQITSTNIQNKQVTGEIPQKKITRIVGSGTYQCTGSYGRVVGFNNRYFDREAHENRKKRKDAQRKIHEHFRGSVKTDKTVKEVTFTIDYLLQKPQTFVGKFQPNTKGYGGEIKILCTDDREFIRIRELCNERAVCKVETKIRMKHIGSKVEYFVQSQFVTRTKEIKKGGSIVHIPDQTKKYPTPWGPTPSKDVYMGYLKKSGGSCGFCSTPLDQLPPEEVHFMRDGYAAYCEDCKDNPYVAEICYGAMV